MAGGTVVKNGNEVFVRSFDKKSRSPPPKETGTMLWIALRGIIQITFAGQIRYF